MTETTFQSEIDIQEAITLTSGLPTHEGFVADIFHQPGADYAISRAKRNITRGPQNIEAWLNKINNTRDARTAIERDGRFKVLTVPKVRIIDKSLGYAQIEWAKGVNLGHRPDDNSTYDLFGFESKARGVLEYMMFVSKLNYQGKVLADHKKTSLVAGSNKYTTKRGTDNEILYKYSMVDVSIENPEEKNVTKDSETMWAVELGKTRVGNVIGGNLENVITGFYITDTNKLNTRVGEIYKLLIPHRIAYISNHLGSYANAAQVVKDISYWQLGISDKSHAGEHERALILLKEQQVLTRRYSSHLEELHAAIGRLKSGDESDYRVSLLVSQLAACYFIELNRQ